MTHQGFDQKVTKKSELFLQRFLNDQQSRNSKSTLYNQRTSLEASLDHLGDDEKHLI